MASLGKVCFNASVEVLNADDTVSLRQMAYDGRVYDVDDDYFEDDAASLELDLESEGMTFLDAVQDCADDGLNMSGIIDFDCNQRYAYGIVKNNIVSSLNF